MAPAEPSASGLAERLGRAFALVIIVGVLAVQTAAIALGAGGRFWPFLRYPMYSMAGRPEFSHRDLCVSLGDRSVSVQGWDLGITSFEFIRLLGEAARDTPPGDRARDVLSTRVAQYIGPDARLDLWRARFEIGPAGLVDASPPWMHERSWPGAAAGHYSPLAPEARRMEAGSDWVRSGKCDPFGS